MIRVVYMLGIYLALLLAAMVYLCTLTTPRNVYYGALAGNVLALLGAWAAASWFHRRYNRYGIDCMLHRTSSQGALVSLLVIGLVAALTAGVLWLLDNAGVNRVQSRRTLGVAFAYGGVGAMLGAIVTVLQLERRAGRNMYSSFFRHIVEDEEGRQSDDER